MKRLISLLLTLAMLLGVVAIAPFTAYAEESTEEYVFRLVDDISIIEVYALAFNSYTENGEIDESDSQKILMEDKYEYEVGYPVYEASFNSSFKYITFVGEDRYGTIEEAHYIFEKCSDNFYYYSTGCWYDSAENVQYEHRVYFVDSSNWGTIEAKAYYVDEETGENVYSNISPSYYYDKEEYVDTVYYFTFDSSYDYVTFYSIDSDENFEVTIEYWEGYFYDCSTDCWYGSLSEIVNDGSGDDNWDDGGDDNWDDGGDDNYEDDGIITFYAEIIDNCENIYAYASIEEIDDETGLEVVISSNATEEYPFGQPMEKMEGIKSADGNDIYKLVVEGDYQFISFNNGVGKGEEGYEWSEKLDFYDYDDKVYKFNRFDRYESFEEAIYGPVDEYVFTYDEEAGTATILECTIQSGVVEIPSKLMGYTVTELDINVFSDSDITGVVIPETVEKIGRSIFWNCPDIESIVVAEGNPNYTSKVNDEECNAVFDKNVTEVIVGCMNTVIPDTVTKIGESAFGGSSIESVVLGENIEIVEDSAFYDCDALTNINISKNVTSIAYNAFEDCSDIETIIVDSENPNYSSRASDEENAKECSVLIDIENGTLIKGSINAVIPERVTAIADGAFYNLSTYTGVDGELKLHEGITYIGLGAFYQCNLNSIYIPASVSYIGDRAFAYCSDVESIVVNEDNKVYYSKDKETGEECNAIIGTVTSAYDPNRYDPFFEETDDYEESNVSDTRVTLIQGCINTVIPDEVEVVGAGAFEGMTNLIEIIIPESVIRVEESAFFNCMAMRRITVMNKDCLINAENITLGEKAVIRGYNGSNAHNYAFKYNKRFLSYEETEDWGTIKESTFYFVNIENWDRVYAYVYSQNGDKYSEEPVIMTISPDIYSFVDVYEFTFDHKYDYVIFTDSKFNANQRDETTFESSKFYNSYDNIWYDSLYDINPLISGYYMLQTDKDGWYYSHCSYINKFEKDPKTDGEYILVPEIYREDESEGTLPVSIKVVNWNGENITQWFQNEVYPESDNLSPEGDEPPYTFDAMEYDCPVLHFNPEGRSDWDYTYINVENHYYNENGECEYCGEIQPDKDVVLKGNSITLSGKIEVNFFMAISDEIANAEDKKVVFTYPDGTKENPNNTSEFTLDFSETDINDYYDFEFECFKFTCPVAAKEMTGDIKLDFYCGDEKLAESSCSVKGYLEKLLKDPAKYNYEIPLAKALLNYGAASQQYFGYKTNDLANNSDYMNESDKQLRQEINLEEYYPSIDNYLNGVTYYGSSLLLDSATSVIHYFIIDESVDVSTLTFTVNDEEVTGDWNGDLYEIVTPEIYAQKLEDDLCLSINYGELTLNYNAFSFGYLIMNSDGKEELKDVVRALYDYNEAANEYLWD